MIEDSGLEGQINIIERLSLEFRIPATRIDTFEKEN